MTADNFQDWTYQAVIDRRYSFTLIWNGVLLTIPRMSDESRYFC